MTGEQSIRSIRKYWRNTLDTVATLAMIGAAITVTWVMVKRSPVLDSRGPAPEPPLPTTPLSIENTAVKGNAEAPAALVVFSDFQCPFCGRFERETLPRLEAEYVRSGRLLLAFRHSPLPMHGLAQKAAEAAECARRQGRFWQMHDLEFSNPSRADLESDARTIGLDHRTFGSCLQGEAAETIAADTAVAKTLGVRGTPTFFFGSLRDGARVSVTGRLSGALPLSEFEREIGKALQAADRTSSR